MLCVIDVGNTNTVIGVFDGESLLASWRLGTREERTADEYGMLMLDLFRHANIALAAVDGVIVSCVVPTLAYTFSRLSTKYFGREAMQVGPGIKTGMPILYDNPREVGADRIVNAVAAYHEFQEALVIVDFGTATTFDAITARGEYLGGAIAPGINISMDALFRHAAKLPRVEFARPRAAIGKNTVASMQSGVFFGYVGLVDALVTRIREELGGSARVIGTGGLATLIAKGSETIDAVDGDLTLKGLRIIHGLNQ
ncbi:type III pantothenate kinase [bacterium]|nr:type III pantothenate kinase [bacterium]